MDLLELLNTAVTSKMGTAVAAFVLALFSVLLQQVPSIKAWADKSPVLSKVSMLVLAVVPAVVVSLTSTASWSEAALTAVLTGLGALGLGALQGPVVEFFKKLFKKS